MKNNKLGFAFKTVLTFSLCVLLAIVLWVIAKI